LPITDHGRPSGANYLNKQTVGSNQQANNGVNGGRREIILRNSNPIKASNDRFNLDDAI
jgi:hypothetical protein